VDHLNQSVWINSTGTKRLDLRYRQTRQGCR